MKHKPTIVVKKLNKHKVFSKFNLSYAIPIIVLFAAIGMYTILFGKAATPTTANVWVAANGNDSGSNCKRFATPTINPDSSGATLCKSFNKAISLMQQNESAVAMAGNYSSQSINFAAAGVTLFGDTASGGVTVPSLSTSGSNYTLQDITVDTGTLRNTGWGVDGSNITGKNIKLHGPYVRFIPYGSTNVTWKGGELGQSGLTGGKRVCGIDDEPVYSIKNNNLTIDSVNFYAQDYDGNPVNNAQCVSMNGFHLEMIRLDHGTDGFTLKNSSFINPANDDTSTIFITHDNSSDVKPQNIKIFNNFFGPDQNPSITVHNNVSTCNNYMIAYNTFVNDFGYIGQGANNGGCTTLNNVVIVGNLGVINTASSCTGTHIKNLWQAQGPFPCGSDVVQNGPNWSTSALGLGSSDGFHLVSGSPAINFAETAYCTSILGNLDHDGGNRSNGTNCDAGADEFGVPTSGGDTTPPTVNMTAPSANATLNGTITLSANATDNVGVVGVQFKVDGNNIGSEDTSSPYSVSWDSTTISNGSHTITAVARDAAGNTQTSSGISININNTSTNSTFYISPSGSDANACSQVSPCRTIGGTYAKSTTTPGSNIIINTGTYGNETIGYKANMSGGDVNNPKPVIVKPASGATVNFTDISERAEYITFQGPNFNARSFDVGCDSGGCTRIKNVIIDGLNIDAQDTVNLDAMYITNVTGLTLKNSRVGNTMAGPGSSDTAKSVMFCGGTSTCQAENVLFEGNTFYDADAPTGSAAHLECIFATGIQGFTVRKNRFQDCTYFDIFITVILINNQPQPKDYIIEDNLFGRTLTVAGTEGGFAINVHNDVQPNNFQFIRNTIEGALSTASGGGAIQSGGWTIAGNIISEGVWLSDSGAMDCRPGITFSYNVMPNTCGSNTTTSSTATIKSGWLSQKGPYAGEDDFHLKSTASAINKGRPSDANTLDFAGVTRGNPPDAGAYEYTSGGGNTCSTKQGDTNNDNAVNILDISAILSAYGQTGTTSCTDVNKDGSINIQDISLVLSKYGS